MICQQICEVWYTHAIKSLPRSFLALNHHNIRNWVPSILTQNLWLILMGMKQKNAASKKVRFSKSPILNIFLGKFYGLVLGLVGLNDAKGIMGLNLCGHEAVWNKKKTGKKCIFWVFRPFLSFCCTASRPYRLSHINAHRIN